MKVGVLLPDIQPKDGGGYTFQSGIVKTLPLIANETRHEFCIITDPKNVHLFSRLPDSFSTVRIPEEPRWARRYANRTFKLARKGSRFVLQGIGIHPARMFSEPPAMSPLECAVRKANIDIIWSPGPPWFSLPNLPYIATIWDLQHRVQPFFPEVLAYGAWQIRENFFSEYLRKASFVTVGTKIGQDEVARFYQIPIERIRVLPLPAPFGTTDSFEQAPDRALSGHKLPEDFIFYPAQFWPHKNHVNLLIALQILRDRHNLFLPLVLTGADQGTALHVRECVNHLGLSDNVYMLGFVPQEDFVALYQKAFALTYVSFFGPDNLPPLEAFALGCPVIAADVPGAREQLGDAAILVNPLDPNSIANAILSLRNNPHVRNSLIEKGLERSGKWNHLDYLRAIISIIDEFEPIRRCWAR